MRRRIGALIGAAVLAVAVVGAACSGDDSNSGPDFQQPTGTTSKTHGTLAPDSIPNGRTGNTTQNSVHPDTNSTDATVKP